MLSAVSRKILEFNEPRLPGMLRVKYEAMAENAFRFYRATCHLFYEELSKIDIPASPLTWICGDLHLENYGSYKAGNRLIYFDLNDFDEAVLAPALWEVIRLLVSIYLAFDVLGIEEEKAANMAALFLRSYAATLANGKAVCIDPRTAKGIVRSFLGKAKRSSYPDLLHKRTEKQKNDMHLSLKDERHSKVKKVLKKALKAHIGEWIKTSEDGPFNYKVVDVVFRLAGTGSLGVKRYLFLLKSTNIKDKYLLLDMKQSFPSALSPYVQTHQPAWDSEASRIITIQKRMQNVPSSLLSTTEFQGDVYVIQELQPVKDTIKFKLIRNRYRDIFQVIDDMAILTASAQLRSSGLQGSAIADKLIRFGTDTSWRDKAVAVATQLTAKMKKSYRQFLKDYKSGLYQ